MSTLAMPMPRSIGQVEPAAPGLYTLLSVPMSRGTGRANHSVCHLVRRDGQFVRSFASKRVAERFVARMNGGAK